MNTNDASSISTTQMTEYLRIAMGLESSVYMQKEAIKQARKNLKRKEPKKKIINKPNNMASTINKPQPPSNSKTEKTSIRALLLIFIGFTSLIFAIFSFVKFTILLGVILIFITIPFLILGFSSIGKYKNEKINYQQELKEYKKSIRNYENQVKKANDDYNRALDIYNHEIKEADLIYKKELELAEQNYEVAVSVVKQLDKPLEETIETLEKLYNLDYIYPKYRNMIAVSTIYEYFVTGRVASLAGSDGAYNLYEAEIRQNIIINNLDEIKGQLEDIKNNQYSLYSELQNTNAIINGVANDVRKILNSSKAIENYTKETAIASNVTACCTQAIEKNTEALKYLALSN